MIEGFGQLMENVAVVSGGGMGAGLRIKEFREDGEGRWSEDKNVQLCSRPVRRRRRRRRRPAAAAVLPPFFSLPFSK